MRAEANAEKIRLLMSELGKETVGPGRIYLTGGATALLLGWREATVDVDLKADPEPGRFFEALADLKQRLDLNIELAAPADFIPELPNWRERSRFIARFGGIEFFHYDLYSQALSKIERGHSRDLADVQAMLGRGLVEPAELRRQFAAIEPKLIRYPGLDAADFRAKLDHALTDLVGPE